MQFLILSGHRDEGVTKFFLALITQNKYWHYPREVRGQVSRSKQEVLRELGRTGWTREGCFCYLILKDLIFSLWKDFSRGREGREADIGAAACVNPKRLERIRVKVHAASAQKLHSQASLVLLSVHF